ncbi:MAG: hypothetical protein H7293_20055 [Candidatus Saccharibacteria bacterium]|nr:hypothetical protein [Rhodoferax sp.]
MSGKKQGGTNPAPVLSPVTAAPPAVVAEASAVAGADAQAFANAATDATADAQAQADDSVFPLSATLRNNSPIPISETFTHAFMQAGGSSDVVIHDAEHLANVQQNLSELAALNYFDPALLVIDGLPS